MVGKLPRVTLPNRATPTEVCYQYLSTLPGPMSLAGLSTLSTWSTLPGYQANLPEAFRASVWDKVLPPVRLLSEVVTYQDSQFNNSYERKLKKV